MSAKSQPMAGQSDAADDLINELAKLMQQESAGDRPTELVRPSFSVRIPGEDTAPAVASAPAQRFDFERPSAFTGTESSSPAKPASLAATPAKPVATDDQDEPFNFDFGLAQPSRATPQLASKPASAPALAAEIVVPVAPISSTAHDSIADLIAAEFVADLAPAPEPAMPAPPVAVAPAPTPAPQVASPFVATSVAPNLGGQGNPSEPSLRPLNLQPAPRAELDRFKIPPVFGLASRPVPQSSDISPVVADVLAAAPGAADFSPVEPAFAPPSSADSAPKQPEQAPMDDGLGRDPIDEIENLIGRAMRVEFDGKPEPEPEPVAVERPAPSPALRSLATPTAPAVPAATPPRSISTADDAILAAAQATGVEIGWVDGPEVVEDEPVATRRRAPRALGMTRALAGPLVAVTLLLAAGFGLYWVLGLGQESGPAPLLTADDSPVKETPAAQPETAVQQSVVFNEIDGVVPGAEEQLVSRDQTDLNEVTDVPPTADVSEEGLVNRQVRTVTVRPDGTIVSGEDSVAGSTILPVARPVVPDVPGAETASPELLASVDPVVESTPAVAPEPAVVASEPAVAVVPVTPGSTVPAVDLLGNPLAGKTAPVPLIRPAGLVAQAAAAPTSPVNAVVNTPVSGGNSLPPPPSTSLLSSTPAATPAAQPVAAPVQSAAVPGAVEVDALPNNAPAYVQLASQRSEAEARASAQAMVTRYGPLFGGANMEVQRVDLGARGIYYRVRVPANSLQDANTICTNVKAAGGDCFTM